MTYELVIQKMALTNNFFVRTYRIFEEKNFKNFRLLKRGGGEPPPSIGDMTPKKAAFIFRPQLTV